jgi:hypothetical protein
MQILLWFLGPIGRYVLIALAVLGGWAWVKVHYENIGRQKVIHAIAAQDQAAVKEAEHAKGTVQNCFASGGTWDISGGVCQPADPSKR